MEEDEAWHDDNKQGEDVNPSVSTRLNGASSEMPQPHEPDGASLTTLCLEDI